MSSFKIGDRVAVYWGSGSADSGSGRAVGTVTEEPTLDQQCFLVAIDHYLDSRVKMSYFFHPKQMRRLVKKERRRVWIRDANIITAFTRSGTVSCFVSVKKIAGDDIEFIEVRKKK